MANLGDRVLSNSSRIIFPTHRQPVGLGEQPLQVPHPTKQVPPQVVLSACYVVHRIVVGLSFSGWTVSIL